PLAVACQNSLCGLTVVKGRRLRVAWLRGYSMRLLSRVAVLLLLAGAGTGLLALQRGGFQQEDEYGSAREARTYSPDDESGKSEYTWSRLRYTAAGNYGGYGYGRGGNWA